jgi:hypothetical protein
VLSGDPRLPEKFRAPELLPLGPGGHLKLLHLWPGQTPPPSWRRNGGELRSGLSSWQPGWRPLSAASSCLRT